MMGATTEDVISAGFVLQRARDFIETCDTKEFKDASLLRERCEVDLAFAFSMWGPDDSVLVQ